jgi:transcriptional regulator with XRE-family HTH domain
MREEERRQELRRFLKDRRARLSTAVVGLPPTSRRRVKGLRREEVAALAGIGVSWYTALENGEARGISLQTVLAVADALRLSESERDYLLALTGHWETSERAEPPSRLVVETMNATAFPAYIASAAWEIVACNEAFRLVWAIEDGELPVGAVERLFLDPRARRMHGERFASNVEPVLAMLRSSEIRRPSEALSRLHERLMADDLTREIWQSSYEISGPFRANRCPIDSPLGAFTYEALTLPIAGTLTALVVQVPDDESRERLRYP